MAVGPVDGIERELVESSNITSIGYSSDRRVLAVEFKSGDIFHYGDVELELAMEFYAAESKGRFYSSRIKYKKPSRLMTGPCAHCATLGVVGETCQSCKTGSLHYERQRGTLTEQEKGIEAREGKQR